MLISAVDYIVPFRRELVTRQQIDKRQIEFIRQTSAQRNPYGLPPANRSRLAAELKAADTAPWTEHSVCIPNDSRSLQTNTHPIAKS